MLDSGYQINIEIELKFGDYRNIKINISLNVKDLVGGEYSKIQYINAINC